jgi:hypothetical protein
MSRAHERTERPCIPQAALRKEQVGSSTSAEANELLTTSNHCITFNFRLCPIASIMKWILDKLSDIVGQFHFPRY